LYLGKVASYDPGGDLINVYLYDYGSEAYSVTITAVYKPIDLMYSEWNGQTIVYLDGTSRTYDAVGLDSTYQRRATWTVDEVEYTEVQEITESYRFYGNIWIIRTPDGELVDINQAGRTWGVNEDYS